MRAEVQESSPHARLLPRKDPGEVRDSRKIPVQHGKESSVDTHIIVFGEIHRALRHPASCPSLCVPFKGR